MPELVFLRNEEELFRIALADKELSLGRTENNDILIQNPKISRKHARVYLRPDGYVFEDLNSANGSFMGEERIKERVLKDGDEIRLADHFMIFQAVNGSPVARLGSRDGKPPQSMHVGALQPGKDWEALRSVLVDTGSELEGAKRLQALFEISKALEEAKDFNAVLMQIMDKAIAILGADRGFLMLADADSGELKIHVARDRKGDIQGVERETMSRSVMRRVMESRKPVLLQDAQSEEWGSQSVLAHSILSALCAPLMTRDAVTGVIYVDQQRPSRAFSKQDLSFFATFALQAKTAIDSSRAYWELVDSLFRASGDFIVVCSTGGQIKQANRAAAELLALTEEELATRKLEDIVAEEDRGRASSLCGETVETGVVSGRELGLKGRDGRYIPLSISSFALRDRTGNAIGVCLIGRDLSELKSLIAGLTSAKRELEKHNTFIRKTFGRYLSDEVVTSLLESPGQLDLGGAKRTVTILMSDLRGFTSLAERVPPEQVVSILNQYLGTMVEIITKHRGIVDEFIGDAILVIFGAPILREDDALRAAACAVEMQCAMVQVNEWTRANGLPELEMGIALNTGDVVVGNIGSQKRSKYAVVGRHVNLASRIESNTVGGQILISEGTSKHGGEALQLGRSVDLHVKGVQGAARVYELLGVAGAYNLHLPEVAETIVDLPEPFTVRYAVLDGKQVGLENLEGRLTRLGRKHAELSTAEPLSPLTNIKLRFIPGTAGPESEDAYAKVLDEPASTQGRLKLRFTSIPPDVSKLLDTALAGA